MGMTMRCQYLYLFMLTSLCPMQQQQQQVSINVLNWMYRVFIPLDTNQKSPNKDSTYERTEAFVRPLSFQTVFAVVWEKHRTKFLTQALSLSSAYHRDTKLTLFLETSRLEGLSVRSMYYCNTPTTFYFMSK